MADRGYKTLELMIPPPVMGVNLATAIDKLQPAEAAQLWNFEFDEYGVIGVPRGDKDLGTPVGSTTVLSAVVFQKEGATTQIIAHFSDGSLRYSTDILTTTTTTTWNTIATGLSTSAPFSFAVWTSVVWMTNGTDNFRKWDGSTQTTYASAPKGKYLAVWKDSLWMAGESAEPHRVRQSSPGDGTTWPALNYVDIEKGVGFGITALYSSEGALVIFKPHRTHTIFDPVEYSNRVIDPSKGCVSHGSIVTHNGAMYFVSYMGVCRYLGDGPSTVVSDKLQPLFDDLFVHGSSLATQVRTTSRDAEICGVSFENFVAWFIPNSPFAQVIKYFPQLPETPWTFGSPTLDSTSGRVVLFSVQEKLKYQQLYYFAGSSASKAYRAYGETSLSVTNNAEWRTGWLVMESPHAEKYLYEIYLLARGIITVEVAKDYDPSTLTALTDGSGATSDTSDLRETCFSTDIYARAFMLKFTVGTASEKKQHITTGKTGGLGAITRFGSSISSVKVLARLLGYGRMA